MSRTHVSCRINGDDVEFLCDAGESLLDALRDEVRLMGAKEGCGTGDCGACSILMDGRLQCSCLIFAPEADGATIVTVEGIADGDHLHPLQQCFLEGAALAVRRLHAGLPGGGQGAAGPQPRPDRDRGALRAGRQPLPLHGVRQDRPLGAGRSGPDEAGGGGMTITEERAGYRYVGTRPVRHDGLDKVVGKARFAADLVLPGMLHGHVLRSPHAHARIVAIDTSVAEAMPGVRAIITGADFVDLPADDPERNMTRNLMARDKVLYEGHAVAAVAAAHPSPGPATPPRRSRSPTRCCRT